MTQQQRVSDAVRRIKAIRTQLPKGESRDRAINKVLQTINLSEIAKVALELDSEAQNGN